METAHITTQVPFILPKCYVLSKNDTECIIHAICGYFLGIFCFSPNFREFFVRFSRKFWRKRKFSRKQNFSREISGKLSYFCMILVYSRKFINRFSCHSYFLLQFEVNQSNFLAHSGSKQRKNFEKNVIKL
jgi:hypothetical protein